MVWGQGFEPGGIVGPILFIGADQEGSLSRHAMGCTGHCGARGLDSHGEPVTVEGHLPAPIWGPLWSPGEVVQEWLSFYRQDLQYLLTGSWHHVNSGRSSGGA